MRAPESALKNFLVKSTIILVTVWAKKFSLPVQNLNYLQFHDICGYKNWSDNKISPPPSFFDAVVA
jgi:hypothetical protein